MHYSNSSSYQTIARPIFARALFIARFNSNIFLFLQQEKQQRAADMEEKLEIFKAEQAKKAAEEAQKRAEEKAAQEKKEKEALATMTMVTQASEEKCQDLLSRYDWDVQRATQAYYADGGGR